MAHGGKREGSGRRRGSINKATELRQALIGETYEGSDSLKHLCAVLSNKDETPERRFNAAVQLLPYQYAKKPSTEISVRKTLDDFLKELPDNDDGGKG